MFNNEDTFFTNPKLSAIKLFFYQDRQQFNGGKFKYTSLQTLFPRSFDSNTRVSTFTISNREMDVTMQQWRKLPLDAVADKVFAAVS